MSLALWSDVDCKHFKTFPSGSLDCDFEDFASCSWKNVDGDDANWEVGTGSTPSSGTGPSGGYPSGKFQIELDFIQVCRFS